MTAIRAHVDIDVTAPPRVRRWQKASLIGGLVFTVLALIGFFTNSAQAMHSYLIGFMLCVGLALGPMVMLMVWHLTGGGWGVMVRRIFEAATATLPLVALAFIPLVIGLHANYAWSRPEELVHAEEHARMMTQSYLRMSAFLFRGILYFIVWGVMAWFLLKWSREQDSPPDRVYGRMFRLVSGPGIVIYAWTMTFASVDWIMSLSFPWASSILPFIFMVNEGMIGMALIVIVAQKLHRYPPMDGLLKSRHFHDYGKFLLMFTLLWGWFNFSQWLIIWAGNLPDEISWYFDRIKGGWEYIAFLIIIGQFVVPFCLLLSRPLKKDPNRLVWVTAWMFFMRYVDMVWWVEPTFHKMRFHYDWLDAIIPLAMLGWWMAYFFWQLQRRPLLVLHDPHTSVELDKEHE